MRIVWTVYSFIYLTWWKVLETCRWHAQITRFRRKLYNKRVTVHGDQWEPIQPVGSHRGIQYELINFSQFSLSLQSVLIDWLVHSNFHLPASSLNPAYFPSNFTFHIPAFDLGPEKYRLKSDYFGQFQNDHERASSRVDVVQHLAWPDRVDCLEMKAPMLFFRGILRYIARTVLHPLTWTIQVQ